MAFNTTTSDGNVMAELEQRAAMLTMPVAAAEKLPENASPAQLNRYWLTYGTIISSAFVALTSKVANEQYHQVAHAAAVTMSFAGINTLVREAPATDILCLQLPDPIASADIVVTFSPPEGSITAAEDMLQAVQCLSRAFLTLNPPQEISSDKEGKGKNAAVAAAAPLQTDIAAATNMNAANEPTFAFTSNAQTADSGASTITAHTDPGMQGGAAIRGLAREADEAQAALQRDLKRRKMMMTNDAERTHAVPADAANADGLSERFAKWERTRELVQNRGGIPFLHLLPYYGMCVCMMLL